MYLLTVRSGLSKGASWPIGERPLIVGRESGCDVRIPDPVVSRQHCEIVFDGTAIHLRDLGSLNLVIVNGRPVNTCTLEVGDEVRIGRVVFFITQSIPEEAAAPGSESPYSTDTLAENESVFLSSPTTPAAQSQAHSDSDLNELFRLSRSLSRINRESDLIHAVGEAINARFAPDHAWFFARQANDWRVTPLPGQSEEAGRPPGREWILDTLEGRQGTLTPKRIVAGDGKTLVQCVLAAPVFFGEHEIGVLTFQRAANERSYHKRDLHFFVALAHVIAPFFKAIERVETLEAENQRLLRAREKCTRMIGSSQEMAEVQRLIRMVAPSMQAVLILGATGTGKELVAVLIHELSERANGPFIIVNCAAIPRELFESEFFGYERGAFTGATIRKIGLMEQSHGGTLFLDEVGDLSPEHQARILRAVETGIFRRIGGREEISADLRIVSATNRDLLQDIKKGLFRTDLYHRLNGVEIRIPPLSQRRSDIPDLARHFLDEACAKMGIAPRTLSPNAIEYLMSLSWSGNVRELKNAIEAANAFCNDDEVDAKDFRMPGLSQVTDDFPLTLGELERRHIVRTIDHTRGNIVEAARILGIGRSTLYNKLAQYGIQHGQAT